MKLSVVMMGVLAACACAYAVEHGPLIEVLQPQPELYQQVAVVDPNTQIRQKRGLLLGAAALGAAALGAGAIGAGVLGAGALGAGVIGAKAGLVGGLVAAKALHGYGGYHGGYGGGYHGGYGGGYGYYEPSYRSYPSYYAEDEWY